MRSAIVQSMREFGESSRYIVEVVVGCPAGVLATRASASKPQALVQSYRLTTTIMAHRRTDVKS